MRPSHELVPSSVLAGDALQAAELLLGCLLVRDDVVVRVTEVEAYRWPNDTANHCRSGRTARNAPMWGPAGRAYVYLCYGLHQMLNVVTGAEGEGCAVLIRSCEPVAGHETLRARRKVEGPAMLTGPGRVGAALGLDRSWCHHDLCAPGGLELRWGEAPTTVLRGPRVGVDYASPEHRAAPWRLAVGGSRWVTRPSGLQAGARPGPEIGGPGSQEHGGLNHPVRPEAARGPG